MNNLKRFLALVLALSMMLTVVPFGAFATETEEQTSEPTESVTDVPGSDVEAMADDGTATTALTIGDKPADGTVTGQPFDPAVSANYRIPGLVNHNGTLIASADARWDYEKDGGGMDLVVSRSEDGNTWNYTFAGYLGDNGNAWNANSSTLMDPVIISDGNTLYLLADMFPAGYSISSSSTTNVFSDTAIGFDASGNLLLSKDGRSTYGYYLKDGKIYTTAGEEQTAYTVDSWFNLYENGTKKTNLFFSDSPFQVRATSYICMYTSTDGGKTWNSPILLNVKPNGVAWMVLGPGSGVVTQDGNIAFTAYDDTNIYLIYGKNGQWNTVQTSAATNESSIIELNDGTIRAFVKRGGNNTIAYVDFARNDNGSYITYTAGNLVDTGVTNFSQCMVSSLHYSKTLNGKEVVLVCCPSKPGAGDWNGRFNGKIHMFTLDGSNNMTLVNSYALNGESQFFAYSNMAELDDGTIGVLYEDDCISYSAGSYYGNASHITYTNVNLETAFGVTFDIMYKDVAWNADSDAGSVEVPVSSGVTSVYAQQAEVSSLTSSYVAYDMHLCGTSGCTGCDNAYTGAATVTLPLTEELKNTGVAGFVVEADGTVTYIYNVKNDGENVTFEVPHFSVVGLAETYVSEQNVELDLDESWEYTDNSGYYVDSYTGAGLDSSIAKVEVNGTNQAGGTEITSVSSVSASQYYVVQTSNGYLTADGGTTNDPSNAAEWQFMAYDDGYYLKNGSNYLTHDDSDFGITNEAKDFYMDGSTIQTRRWSIWRYVYTDVGTVAKKTTTPEVKNTTIKITAVSAGKSSVIVGSTKYNITVNPIVKDIELYVGKSDKFTIEGAYGMADVKVSPDSAIATLDKMEHVSVAATKELKAVTTIESGKQYIIVNKRANGDISGALDTTHAVLTATADGDSLSMNGPVSEDCTEFWTITQSGNGYTIMRDGKYLTMGNGTSAVTTTETVVTLDNTDSRGWLISYNGYYLSDMYGTSSTKAHGYNQRDDGGNFWTIYEVVTTSTTTNTEVTFTGVKAGTTTATIGSVVFNITVKQDTRDITLYSGQDKTFTISGSGYSMDDIKAYPDAAYATIVNVTSTGAELVPVTQIESGKHYLIVNAQTGDVLTNTAVSATGSWDAKPGLETTGKPATDSTELWVITASGNGYTIVRDNKYLTVSGFYAVMSDTETALTLNYTASGWTIMDNTTCLSLTGHDHKDYYLSDNVGEGYDEAALGTGDMSAYCYWNIYEINASGSTNVTFHGVKPTTTPTTATIGHVLYNITVVDGPTIGDIEDFNNIVGKGTYSDNNTVNPSARSDLDMTGKVIKSLRITEGASFLLDVDVKEYDSVVWSSDNESVVTVDENGNVTAVANAVPDGEDSIEAHVTATVIKNGIEESISIKVTVVPSLIEDTTGETSFIFYYIEQVDYTDPYYTMFLNTESTTEPVDGHRLVKVSEGEVIWFERPRDSAFAWVWTADPWEGYALTKMGSSGSVDEYYPLRDVNDITKLGDGYVDVNGNSSFNAGTDSEYYYTSASFSGNGAPNNAYKNVVLVGNDVGASWRDELDAVLGEAIEVGKGTWANYGCDGAMSNTRWGAGPTWADGDRVPDLVTSMTFISNPMPKIEKSVNGILPTTKLRADFAPYYDGMTATVGEYVYFEITVTLERPTVWVKDDNGNDTNDGAIQYSLAKVLDDDLAEGYFYVQDNDKNLNGVIDSNEEGANLQQIDITDDLNANWGENELIRTIDMFLVYEIQKDDIPKFIIDNTADLTWNYQSKYSTGSLAGKANAQASIIVVGHAMDNVVIDFGQSITYTGLTDNELKYASVGADVDYETKYGTVTVTGNGDPEKTTAITEGTYYNSYTVTYTPTSILQEPDVVKIFGTYIDRDGTNDIEDGTKVRKMINSFVVYPATTVYYEEGFMINDASTGWSAGSKATMEQKFELLGKSVFDANDTLTGYTSNKTYAYGYDPIYNGDGINDVAKSEIISNNVGDTTSFQFTGTGFELYANCDTTTGRVAVSVYKADGTLEQMYVVNTVAADGSTAATDGQDTNLNSLPIVSVKDMAHGTYTVKLTKVVNDSMPVYIDGVRIINTVKDSTVFQIDLEDNPEFYQLRDYVLNAINVGNVTDSMYTQLGGKPGIALIADQIYAGISTDTEAPYAVVLADGKYNSDVQDLLDNGPKNELYLHAGETLLFTVKTSRALQIGLKAPAGETSYSITGATTAGTSGTLKTSTDMFYALGNTIGTETTYTITVTNDGSNILSVTDLKICDDPNAVFVPLTVEDIKATLVTMGYGVAENTITGESFETVSAALAAAKDGETVKLLADCTETNLMVTAGVTLDLNGFNLTASYVVAFDSAHVVDNAGGGCLTIGIKNLVLDEENAMIPVYTGEGYVFTKAGFAIRQNAGYTGEGIKIDAMAYPLDMNVVEQLKNGAADNNIEIIIRLTWDTDQGTGSQDFKFNDDVVASVYSSNNGSWNSYGKMFSMVVTGFQNIENLKANIIVVSGTNAEYVSSKTVDIT